MQNSFLIKNHESANFEQYLALMRRRKQDKDEELNGNLVHSATKSSGLRGQISAKKEGSGFMLNKIPAARDGHSAVVFDERMIIFGGDRHRMPFSDTYSLNIRVQLQGKGLV
jgi:hypothetical protein